VKGSDWAGLVVDLEAEYGRLRFIPRFDPMEELVSCILSQHTSDRSSFPAFTQLMARYGSWEAIAAAPRQELADTIRGAGLANQKAKSIQESLRLIHERSGAYSLTDLATMSDREAREWLESLPGVGPKTAAIVLCFGFGRHAIPVDTHVHRVCLRLGIIPPKTDANRAHDVLLDRVPVGLAFRFHTALIQHGRLTCQAKTPACHRCRIADRCALFQQEQAGVPRTQSSSRSTKSKS